ncbi:MAG: hypothetical protein ACI8ZB_004197 [Desulforhopalus sp.]|jgi:hypothetical protein
MKQFTLIMFVFMDHLHNCQMEQGMKDKNVTSIENIERGLREKSSSGEIASFLKAVGEASLAQNGRLIFSLDATNSRQPTWDRAMTIQSSMFNAVGEAGGLSVQLVYFRGLDECRASKWVINAAALRDLMLGIKCRGGQTQIAKILNHAYRETTKEKVSAMVFIGDAIEESIDSLCQKAGELGLKGVRCFFFQEGHDVAAENGFREMARLTGGAYFRLGPDSAKELAELLSAVAIYARGGLKALSSSDKNKARLLLQQMRD